MMEHNNTHKNTNHLDVKIVVQRAKTSFTNALQGEDELRDIYDLAMPNRNVFKNESDKTTDIFDSTAVNSTMRFANRLQTELTPPFQRWGELKPGPVHEKTEKTKLKRLIEDLQFVSKVVHGALQSGGFTTAAHECYQDLAAGQAALAIMPGDMNAPVRYTAFPQAETATELGQWDQIIGLHIKKKIDANQILNFWPKGKLSDKMKEMVKAGDSDGNSKKTKLDIFISYIWQKNETWEYHVTWPDDNFSIFTQEFPYQPFAAPRWSRLAGDSRGRGPLHVALPDIKTINKVKELLLMSAALAIVGIYTIVDDGVVNPNTVRLVPGALIGVSSNGSGFAGPSIKQLETGRNFDLTQLLLEDLRISIKKALLDDQLPPDAGPVRSATEIVQRIKELAQDSGAAFGRLYDEWIVPIFKATIAILQQQKIIPSDLDIPIDSLNFKIQVTSPLARIQDIQDLEGVIQYLNITKDTMGEETAEVAVKMEELNGWIAKRLGVPMRFIRNEEEREEVKQQFAEIVKQQNAANQGVGQGPTVAAAA